MIRSVTLLYERSEASRLRLAVEPLGKPLRTDAPTPQSAFIEKWSRKEHIDGMESTAAELFVFGNAKAAKKLEVFAWTIQQWNALHYAFLLQLLDMQCASS